MDFTFSPEQEAIRDAVGRICARYDDAYWLAHDRDGGFPEDFVTEIAAGGWLGIAMPEHLGGAGQGVTEAAIIAQTIAESGACLSGASAIHINLFGPMPLVVFGTEEQKERNLPPLIKGEDRCCFGVTEPDAGLNTTSISTKAERDGDHYVVHGRKMWTSTAQTANKILLLARTTPKEKCAKPTVGLSLFYTDLDRGGATEVREIEKMGRKAVDSNAVFFDGLRVPAGDLISEEGKGFQYQIGRSVV